MAEDGNALGELLQRARGRMSIREAARRAGISEGRWRQVEKGVQKLGRGMEVSVRPRPSTIVAMANAVGVAPVEALEAAGEHDEADRWRDRTEPLPGMDDIEPDDPAEYARQHFQGELLELALAWVEAEQEDAKEEAKRRTMRRLRDLDRMQERRRA